MQQMGWADVLCRLGSDHNHSKRHPIPILMKFRPVVFGCHWDVKIEKNLGQLLLKIHVSELTVALTYAALHLIKLERKVRHL